MEDIKPIKILFFGSPCTHWSICQKNNRETEPNIGIGWELFKNCIIAKEKFKPDFFLYENNKSASPLIKNEIGNCLGINEPNTNVRLTYINSALVSAQNRQRFYVTNFGDIEQPKDRGILLKDILESTFEDNGYELKNISRIPKYGSDKSRPIGAYYSNNAGGFEHRLFSENTAKQQIDLIVEPIRVGSIGSNSQAHRVYSCNGKSINITANGGGQGGKTGLYLTPICENKYANNIYEVKNNFITIKDKEYPINLIDGYYIIRKLTVKECERLQTLPDGYCSSSGVSNSQCYKGIGNGWTAEVIIHLLNHALKDIPKDTPLEVLSLYDGIGTGRYCLDKMGFTNVKYKAYEIDKYAKQIANYNYQDIIQCGDAFQVREDNWKY